MVKCLKTREGQHDLVEAHNDTTTTTIHLYFHDGSPINLIAWQEKNEEAVYPLTWNGTC